MKRSPLALLLALAFAALATTYLLTRRDPASRPQATVEAPRVESTPPCDPSLLQADPLEQPITLLAFLYDASLSFHTREPDAPFTRAAGLFPALAQSFRKRLPSPQRYMVSTIGALSFGRAPACDLQVPAPTLFRRPCSEEQLNALFADRFSNCKKQLLSLPGERSTDIAGALAASALTLRSQEPLIRGLIVFSDLVEGEQVGAQKATAIDLGGICVALLYDFVLSDALNPDEVPRRVDAWTMQLRNHHAKAVLVEHLRSISSENLIEFLERCQQ